MAARAVTRAYDVALKPLGLETTQFTLLAAISANPARSVTALADRLALERTSLSRNLALLVRRGLVEATGRQGRAVAYAVTEPGQRLLAEAVPLWRSVQNRIEEAVGQDDWRRTRETLRSIRRGLREDASGCRSGA